MYREELSNYHCASMFIFEEVLCVGWLDKKHPFKQKVTNEKYIEKLTEIYWGSEVFDSFVNIYRCLDTCDLCGTYDSTKVYDKESRSLISFNEAEIWIPSIKEGVYYASPSVLIHYIQDHQYSPPKEYWNAVMNVDLEKRFNAVETNQELIDKYRNGKTFF